MMERKKGSRKESRETGYEEEKEREEKKIGEKENGCEKRYDR